MLNLSNGDLWDRLESPCRDPGRCYNSSSNQNSPRFQANTDGRQVGQLRIYRSQWAGTIPKAESFGVWRPGRQLDNISVIILIRVILGGCTARGTLPSRNVVWNGSNLLSGTFQLRTRVRTDGSPAGNVNNKPTGLFFFFCVLTRCGRRFGADYPSSIETTRCDSRGLRWACSGVEA